MRMWHPIILHMSLSTALQLLSFCTWLKDVVKKLDNKVYWKEVQASMTRVIQRALQGTTDFVSFQPH